MDIDIRTLHAPQESVLEDALEALSPSEKISPRDDICGVFSWWFSLKENKRLQCLLLNLLTLIFTAVSFNLGGAQAYTNDVHIFDLGHKLFVKKPMILFVIYY